MIAPEAGLFFVRNICGIDNGDSSYLTEEKQEEIETMLDKTHL